MKNAGRRHAPDSFIVITIFAGYPDEMKRLMISNPGVQSRIKYVVDFVPYSNEELLEITYSMAQADGYDFAY